jgi:hypothetical protein
MYLLIYLIGIPLAYITIRHTFKAIYGEWAKSDRVKGIAVSFLSFLTVFIALVMYFFLYENNEESDW